MVRFSKDERDVVHFPREVFLTEVWDYQPGEHVTVLAPSGGGKTQLASELLEVTMSPECPAVILVMKPRDATVVKYAAKNKLRTVRDWPPVKDRMVARVFREKPRGYVLWPKETGDPDIDDERHTEIFRRAIREQYRRGDTIIFADETYSLENEMGLKTDLNRVWTKGRSMGTGLWAASQRPRYISLWAYQSHHLFIAKDPDESSKKRLAEIGGGIDPDVVLATIDKLERYEFIYINRDERTMCIVGA
jgi:hypothetical protein